MFVNSSSPDHHSIYRAHDNSNSGCRAVCSPVFHRALDGERAVLRVGDDGYASREQKCKKGGGGHNDKEHGGTGQGHERAESVSCAEQDDYSDEGRGHSDEGRGRCFASWRKEEVFIIQWDAF
jgi:hypothetical protein